MRGRKPKPQGLRVLEGRTGSRYHQPKGRTAVLPRPVAPECPDGLGKEAAAEWGRLAPELGRLGLLTSLDREMFMCYCSLVAELAETQRAIKKHGRFQTSARGIVRLRPEVRIAHQTMTLIRQIASEFGLTPSSRVRLSVPTSSSDDPHDIVRLLD